MLVHKCCFFTTTTTLSNIANCLFALLKALLPVCMKYTAWGERWVANIARGKLYLSLDSHQKLYTFIQKVLFYTLKGLNKIHFFKIQYSVNMHIYWIKMFFFDKNVSLVLLFYNYFNILQCTTTQ